MDPILAGALIALAASLATAAFSFAADRFKSRRDFEHDINRVRADFMAENVARHLLDHEENIYRSSSMIRHYLGGYDDNELRKILVRAGAVRVISKSGIEMWVTLENLQQNSFEKYGHKQTLISPHQVVRFEV